MVLQILEEEVEVPVSAAEQPPKESVKMGTGEAANDSSKTETDVNMEDVKTSVGVDNGVPESEERPAEMETDNKVPNLYLFCLVIFVLRFHFLIGS